MSYKLLSTCLREQQKLRMAMTTLNCYYCNIAQLKIDFCKFGGGSVDLTKDEACGVASIVMNNPSTKNALTGKMMVDFHNCVTELEDWKTGQAVILSGAAKTFCSGGDLHTVQENMDRGGEMAELMQDATARLFNLPMISVAAISGHALGGGAELATACDFRIMTQSGKLGFVQAKLNVATGWGGCTRLVRLIGRTKTLLLLASGHLIDSTSALEIGLINGIASDGDIVVQAREWLKKICAGDVKATRTLKRMVIAGKNLDEKDAYIRERELFCKVFGRPEHKEALDSQIKYK